VLGGPGFRAAAAGACWRAGAPVRSRLGALSGEPFSEDVHEVTCELRTAALSALTGGLQSGIAAED